MVLALLRVSSQASSTRPASASSRLLLLPLRLFGIDVDSPETGQKFRLRGKGVPASAAQGEGDLYASIQIVPPKALDQRSRELLEEFDRLNPTF